MVLPSTGQAGRGVPTAATSAAGIAIASVQTSTPMPAWAPLPRGVAFRGDREVVALLERRRWCRAAKG
jgi:hypothetical protein